jgi:hypothetical protein
VAQKVRDSEPLVSSAARVRPTAPAVRNTEGEQLPSAFSRPAWQSGLGNLHWFGTLSPRHVRRSTVPYQPLLAKV